MVKLNQEDQQDIDLLNTGKVKILLIVLLKRSLGNILNFCTIDTLSLVLGRTKLVRDLTEHDFHGSNPIATSRIPIVSTIGGFSDNDPQ